jgi:hypothetical protein
LVSVIKKPTSVADDVVKTPTMLGKNSALPVDLEDLQKLKDTIGRIRS